MPPRWRRLVASAPVFLLCLVAIRERWLVETAHLSAWKGGGFGMFSTTHSPGSRTLRLLVHVEDRDYVAIVPRTKAMLARQIRTLPSQEALAELARQLAAESWTLGRAGGDERVTEFAMVALPNSSGRKLAVKGVRAEVWQIDFDATQRRLIASLLLTSESS